MFKSMNTDKSKALFVLMVFFIPFLILLTDNSAFAETGEALSNHKALKIVIDPGHGGKIPGAIGPNGEKEKDITLSVSNALAKRLREDGFEVLLTRDEDVDIPLKERTTFANKNNADLFVSIHVNAHESKSKNGVETYFLNLTTDAASRKVAQRENFMSDEALKGLQLIIKDLMLNTKINESSRFATSIQRSVVSSLRKTGYKGKNLGVKEAPFYVLMGARMPAILIEIGFITNNNECKLLHNDSHLESIIEGMAKGIKTYRSNTNFVYSSSRQKAEVH